MTTDSANYYVSEGSNNTVLGPPSGYLSGEKLSYWTSGRSTTAGYMYSNGSVRTIAGMKVSGATFAGISGTPAIGLPTSGTATSNGAFSGTYFRYGSYYRGVNSQGYLTTNVDFSNGTLQGSGTGTFGSRLQTNGTIIGGKFNGTASFSALESGGQTVAPMTGGFFGSNTMAGIYKGGTVAGVFFGQ